MGLLACAVAGSVSAIGGARAADDGIQKIQHVVIIMQENRSFDSYFGTYPGAEGLPQQNGKFTVCVNDPQKGTCVYPYHDPADRNSGGPHGTADSNADVNGGNMDGFIQQAEKPQPNCQTNADTNCDNSNPQSVMGYHDA